MTTRRHLAERIREEREIQQLLSPRAFRRRCGGLSRWLRQEPRRRVVLRTKLVLLELRERQRRKGTPIEVSPALPNALWVDLRVEPLP